MHCDEVCVRQLHVYERVCAVRACVRVCACVCIRYVSVCARMCAQVERVCVCVRVRVYACVHVTHV